MVHLAKLLETAETYAESDEPGEALFAFLREFAMQMFAKRDLIEALSAAGIDIKSQCAILLDEFKQRVGTLLQRATAAGDVRGDTSVEEVLGLIGGVCHTGGQAGSTTPACNGWSASSSTGSEHLADLSDPDAPARRGASHRRGRIVDRRPTAVRRRAHGTSGVRRKRHRAARPPSGDVRDGSRVGTRCGRRRAARVGDRARGRDGVLLAAVGARWGAGRPALVLVRRAGRSASRWRSGRRPPGRRVPRRRCGRRRARDADRRVVEGVRLARRADARRRPVLAVGLLRGRHGDRRRREGAARLRLLRRAAEPRHSHRARAGDEHLARLQRLRRVEPLHRRHPRRHAAADGRPATSTSRRARAVA